MQSGSVMKTGTHTND